MSEPVNLRRRGEWVEDEADELLPLAVHVGGIGIYVTDFERNRTRFSPELCTMLGLPVGTEMSYAQASRVFDERDRAAVQASVEAAVSSPDRGKWNGVHRVVRADGTIRWVAIHGRRIYRDTRSGPQAVRSIGTVIDITHLKETEAALHENELRLRLALDAAQMGTFEADITASHALIDAQEARLLGLPEDTRVVSSTELRKRVPLEDLNASDVKQERLTQHHEPYHHEFRMRLPDGSERWLSAYAAVRSNRIFGVNFDVTERKRAEAALRESEARLRVATSGAALGVFEWDAESDLAIWENDRMYEIFGRAPADGPLSRRQFVGKFLHSGDAHEFKAALDEATRTNGNFHMTCRIRRKDGSRRWLQIDGRFGAGGHPLRLVGVVADITDRRKLERQAQRLTERLITIQEEERRRIAQELHDSTVQHLVAASLTLMKLRPRASLRREKKRLWGDVEASLDEAMKELRAFSYLMNPPALQANGLHTALEQYVEGFAGRSGLDIKLRSSAKIDRLSVRTQRSLFRIVQEAMANVYHHASASRISITLRPVGTRLHLVISDDGRGISAAMEEEGSPRQRGTGMRGIKARLSEVGGYFRITQLEPHGTRIHAAVPIDRPPRMPGTSFGLRRARSHCWPLGRSRVMRGHPG
jgi:PAS domain S-box-containing protein